MKNNLRYRPGGTKAERGSNGILYDQEDFAEDWQTEFEIMIENFIFDGGEEYADLVLDRDENGKIIFGETEDAEIYASAHDSKRDYMLMGLDGNIIIG